MSYKESIIRSHDGLDLRYREWTPAGKPKGVIILVHGLGEHGGRYGILSEYLVSDGYALTTCDLRGHGLSQGQHGHTESYEVLLKDVAQLILQSNEQFPGIRQFLYGHSMGGNIVLNYVLRYTPNLKGVIVTSPWLRLAFEPPKAKIKLAGFMNHIWPNFSQSSGLETSALTRSSQIVQAYKNDPIVHSKISVRLFKNMFEAGLWALDHASEFPLPLLLMHGSGDRITSFEASCQFASLAKNCTFKLWEGFYHELHNEPEQEEVMRFISTWLKSF